MVEQQVALPPQSSAWVYSRSSTFPLPPLTNVWVGEKATINCPYV